MPRRETVPEALRSPRLKRLSGLRRLASERSGHASEEHVRHQLYIGRDSETRADALVKVTTKPGVVYEQNLANEIAVLSTINHELPESRSFPLLLDHGRLPDGRMFLIMSLFPEWPLATTIGPERRPDRLVGHLRTTLAVGEALAQLHRIGIFHVDLNSMNILYRTEHGRPVIRIVDFESAYQVSRHGKGEFYNPPTTSGFSAPELRHRAPDARADVFSLGAVLYTLLAGYDWSVGSTLADAVAADGELDEELRAILLRCAAPRPEDRYPSIDAMASAIASYLESIWPGRTS